MSSPIMKAIVVENGGASLAWRDVPRPEPQDDEVLVRVHATALNRADLLQRAGLYPVPPGASPILGLEVAGEIVELGHGVEDVYVGDRVCALVAGGGANPASGYSLIEASSLADAHAKAKGCPLLKRGGTIEIAEAIDM